jgi:hypothetical protein
MLWQLDAGRKILRVPGVSRRHGKYLDTARTWRAFGSKTQEPVQLTTGPMNMVGSPVASRDGKKLFVQGWKPRGELVRYDAKIRAIRAVPFGIISDGAGLLAGGEWVAYNDASDGTMWRSKVDGSQKLQLVFRP